MKNLIKFFLKKISRIIYWLVPVEFKPTKKYNKLELILKDNLAKETFEIFGENFKKSVFFTSTWKIREYAIQTALLNDTSQEYYYLEFGVYKGASANFFSKHVKKLYAFDGFLGLEEDWAGTGAPKYFQSLNKQIPKLNLNVVLTCSGERARREASDSLGQIQKRCILRRYWTVLLQEKNFGPNVIYYVLGIQKMLLSIP